MFEQTLTLSDVPKVFVLTFIEMALSADNAIVLGVLSQSLEERLRKKALFVGIISSVILRAVALLSIAYLLTHVWIQLLGAGYLIYLSASYFFQGKHNSKQPRHLASQIFWKTVVLIECFDFIFAMDSIMAGIAFIGPTEGTIHPKLWIVYVGGILGLIGTRSIAHGFHLLVDRFPHLEASSHLMIGWVGVKLCLDAFHISHGYIHFIFWTGILLLFFYGLRHRIR